MLLMKNLPLDMRQIFMARSSEVLKSPFNDRYDMRQALCVRCVDTSVTRWGVLIYYNLPERSGRL